jgi:hypothetical protein
MARLEGNAMNTPAPAPAPAPKTYPAGPITVAQAWQIAHAIHKAPPYRGYSLDLGNGQMLVHFTGQKGFEIKDIP